MGRSHVAAVDTHRHGTVRQGELSDRLHGGKITGLSLFSQFLFDAFGHGMQMLADRLRIGRLGDRQHFFQQIDHFLERNQRGPLGLQIDHLWTGACPLQPGRSRTEGPRPFGLAWATLPPRVRHLRLPEHRLHCMGASLFTVVALAAGRTYALALQIFGHLLAGYEVLHPVQNGLAFGHAHPESLQGQLRPLQFRHATTLFAAVVETHDFHSERHTRRHLMRSSRQARRLLASSRLKRSGSSGPYSCSRRSMLSKPSLRISR